MKKLSWLSWLATGTAVCLTLSSCRTCHDAQPDADGEAAEMPSCDRANVKAMVLKKMQDIIIPEMSFRPPATIIDAVDFLEQASRDYDAPSIPPDQRGLTIILKLPTIMPVASTDGDPLSPSELITSGNLSAMPAMTARFISLYDALTLVCDVTVMKFRIMGGLVMIVPVEEEGELQRRSYMLSPSASKELWQKIDKSLSEEERQSELKSFFANEGIRWPLGSTIQYFPATGELRVQNIQVNLMELEQVLGELYPSPTSIHAEVQIVAFRAADIEKLQLAGGVTKESLTGLRKAGKSKPVATASAMTRSGQEAIVRTVDEVIYPSEFRVMNLNVSNKVSAASLAVEPQNSTMREVGMILQVIPKVHEGGLIDVVLKPQRVTLDHWETFEINKTLRSRDPVFSATSFETQVTMKDGDTILLGYSTAPDGNWVHAGFLTVRRVNAEP
ncbi:MAG: type II and III secretion system protein [Kiritimatiellaeota bacterium]|nr:type II and III secretion system protein [Kiritimatiellota bacterium]